MPAEASNEVVFSVYQSEKELDEIIQLIDKDLSEPYSVFTYRYFLYNWPELCVLARIKSKVIGVIICRQEQIGLHEHQMGGKTTQKKEEEDEERDEKKRIQWRGYIAMLAVAKAHRKKGIGSRLVQEAIELLKENKKCQEVMLETEVSNKGAIRLYENLGFVRSERLEKYYLNGGDAFRLKLWLQEPL